MTKKPLRLGMYIIEVYNFPDTLGFLSAWTACCDYETSDDTFNLGLLRIFHLLSHGRLNCYVKK